MVRRTTVAPGEAERTLRARREHSKGDGNVPSAEPHAGLVDEKPADRQPRDLPKQRDDRSAPKGNTPSGQGERNPSSEMRDDAKPKRPKARSQIQRGHEAADRTRAQHRAPKRPTARRSSSAKRDAQKKMRWG
jgi:hypothetical protein